MSCISTLGDTNAQQDLILHSRVKLVTEKGCLNLGHLAAGHLAGRHLVGDFFFFFFFLGGGGEGGGVGQMAGDLFYVLSQYDPK